MGAQVQSKTYFPGSMVDLNNGFHNGVWDLYHDDKSYKIPTPGNSQHYDYFLTTQAMDGYTGYAKEQIRQTILKHESIFRHQIQELHRLYRRQRDLMNPVPAEPSKVGHFLSQVPPDVSKEMRIFPPSFPLVDSNFSRASTSVTDGAFSPLDSVKGKSTLKDFGPLISKCGVSERRVIDLELPASVDGSNNTKVFNLADLNEPIQVEETAFSAFFSNINKANHLAEDSQKRESSAKRTLFGVEIGERNHTPSFGLPWRNVNSSVHHNHWLNSSGTMSQNPGFSAGNSSVTTNSTSQNSFVGLHFPNGVNSKDSVSDNLEKICVQEKHRFLDMWKNHENTREQTLPPWLTSKPCFQSEQIKEKQTKVHINLDSLQNHSQQFFKKTETEGCNHTRELKKVKVDDTQSIPKILGVPIIDKKVETRSESKDVKHHIDLNLSLDEEDVPSSAPSFPESVVKIATMEIDLEAPAVLESDTDDGFMDTQAELAKGAAEAIVSISLCQQACKPSAGTLLWFAEVITSNNFKKNEESVPQGMDYFEYMTLKLEDTKVTYDNYNPIIVEEQKEEESGLLSKRTTRKGQGRRGRQRKDFQKDILPSIVSLSRREVTEDLQIFEEALSATGVSWHSSLSKRKASARNGRGRRRLVVADSSCHPPPPTAAAAAGDEQTICREMALEKSLEGWGRRTRRLPRQRCQNGGNHNQSLALKC